MKMKTLIYFKLTSLNTLKQKYKTEIIYHNQSKLSNLNWIFVYVLKFAFESIKFPSCKRSSCVRGKARNCCRTRHYGSYEDVIILVQWHHNDPCIRIVVSVIIVCFSECAAHHVIIDIYRMQFCHDRHYRWSMSARRHLRQVLKTSHCVCCNPRQYWSWWHQRLEYGECSADFQMQTCRRRKLLECSLTVYYY